MQVLFLERFFACRYLAMLACVGIQSPTVYLEAGKTSGLMPALNVRRNEAGMRTDAN